MSSTRTVLAPLSRCDDRIVVGLGASAGGLEVLQRFLRLIPGDSGMTFLVIQHLAPTAPSLLTDILARSTTLRVVEASHGVAIQANTVYVIPPQFDLSLAADTLVLARYTGRRGQHAPIDVCFSSMAEQFGARAVDVIFSGMVTDGTSGCRAILDQGGKTLVQWPEEASHSGMPGSVIQAGNASHVLSVEQMPAMLSGPADAGLQNSLHGQALQQILLHLRRTTGHDFTQYKKSTIARRIERRMQLLHLATQEEYSRLLQISSERLNRYFRRVEGGYRVKKEIRKMIVFAVQNVVKDPPFTRIDLLCCRNLMIYLGHALQNRLIPTFHYALKPDGVLFLSPSESIGGHATLFAPLQRKWKFYRAVKAHSPRAVPLNSCLSWLPRPISRPPDHAENMTRETNIAELTRRALLHARRGEDLPVDPKDVGRPLADISSYINAIDLLVPAQEVLDMLIPQEVELCTVSGSWFLAPLAPYRTLDNVIGGVVMTFHDINSRIASENAVQAARELAEAIVDTVIEPLLVLDENLCVVSASRSYYRTFPTTEPLTTGRKLYELNNRQWDISALRQKLGAILENDSHFDGFVVQHERADAGPRIMTLNARRVAGNGTRPQLILLAIQPDSPVV